MTTDLEVPAIDFAEVFLDPPNELVGGQAWQIHDDTEATWAGRKLRYYEERTAQHHGFAASQKADLMAAYERELKMIEDWEDAAVARELPKVEHFRDALLDYFRQLREADPGLKTYPLPGITLTKRAGSKRLELRDEPATIAWLDSLPLDDPQRQAFRKASVLKSNLLFSKTTDDGALVTKDGELIPGVVQVVGEEKFDVKLEADEDEV